MRYLMMLCLLLVPSFASGVEPLISLDPAQATYYNQLQLYYALQGTSMGMTTSPYSEEYLTIMSATNYQNATMGWGTANTGEEVILLGGGAVANQPLTVTDFPIYESYPEYDPFEQADWITDYDMELMKLWYETFPNP